MGQLHNELLRAHEIKQAIKDALESSEGDVNVERLGETLTPVLDIWSLPEWSFLREECRFVIQRDVVAAGGAGFISFFQVVNPIGSNQLVTIDQVWASTTSSNIVSGSLTVTPRGATGTSFAEPLDGRWLDRQLNYVANLTISKGSTNVAFTEALGLSSQTTGGFLLLNWPPIILPPGVGFFVSDNVANEAMAVQMCGRVRPARAGELG